MSLGKLYGVAFFIVAVLALLGLPGQVYAQQTQPKITPVKKPLNWTAPPDQHISLQAGATIKDDVVTYTIYPINISNRTVWDLHITVPLPDGANFLVAEASPSFISSFDGHTVAFSATELSNKGGPPLLQFQVSVKRITTPLVTTRVSATWRYLETNLGASIFAQAETKSGDIVVESHRAQQVVVDATGDVPFASYDLTGVAFEQDQGNLKLVLTTSGAIGPVGNGRNEYNVYIDSDCAATSGRQRSALGFDYRVRYQHDKGVASLNVWDPTKTTTDTATVNTSSAITSTDTVTDNGKAGGWRIAGSLSAVSPPTGHSISIWVPQALLATTKPLCWAADAQNRITDYTPRPPADQLPDTNDKLLITHYDEKIASKLDLSVPITATVVYTNNGSVRLVQTITPALAFAPPDFATVKGKLALSLANDQGAYDVHLFAVNNGQEQPKISNASHPAFKSDGRYLLLNRKDGVYERELSSGAEVRLSTVPSGTHPVYNALGTAVVYENIASTSTNTQTQQATTGSSNFVPLFQLCDWTPAQSGVQSPCLPLPNNTAFAITPLPGEMRGAYPVWTADDTVVYQGCAVWMQPNPCGIYLLRNGKQSGNNAIFLRQLTHNATDLPTDTKGNVIAFTSQATGDWEVYVMRLDGVWVKNLSQSQGSQDILPTVSPDGNWVAFISNRSGKWAIWVAPVVVGESHKLFDLPGNKPWGDNDQNWQEQRLTWAP